MTSPPVSVEELPAFPVFATSPPPSTAIPRLPPELVGYIIKLAATRLGRCRAFEERCTLLYSCSLVSSAWRYWAERELYGGPLFVLSSTEAQKLLSMLEKHPQRAHEIKDLRFGGGESPETTAALKTYELLKLCTRLRALSLHNMFDFQISWLAMVPGKFLSQALQARTEADLDVQLSAL